MLVLSRQRDETIMIGDDIEITVVDIRGDKVRLGITAPTTIPVHRKEVYEAIKRENREAAKVRMEDLTNMPGIRAPVTPPMRPGLSSGAPRVIRPQFVETTSSPLFDLERLAAFVSRSPGLKLQLEQEGVLRKNVPPVPESPKQLPSSMGPTGTK